MALRLARAYKDIGRYSQVLDVLGKYGFGLAITEIHAHSALPISKQLLKKKFSKEFEITGPVRARLVFEELGPTFVKLGQILSTRPDLVPVSYIKEFEKLQDNVPPVKFSKVKKVIESETGKKIEDTFKSFEKIPMASASIGQVHLARLKSGQRVAVKIQRPGLEKIIDADIDIMDDLAHLAEKYFHEARVLEPTRIIHEFHKTLRREMNYHSEGRNLDRMKKAAKKFSFIKVPSVYWEYTTEKMLVMDYFEGEPLNKWLKKKIPATKRKTLGKNLAKFFVTQILVDGFFQADPHPGNFVVEKDGKIGVLDLGMVGFIDRKMQEKLTAFFISLIEGDSEGVADSFLGIGAPVDATRLDDFKYDLEYLMTQYYNISLKEVSLSELIGELEYLMIQYQVHSPPNFTLFLKAITQVEAILRKIYPDFNVINTVRPILKKRFEEMAKPEAIAKRVGESLLDLNKSLVQVPTKLNSVLDEAKKGRMHFEFEHRGLSKTVRKFDRMTNKLVFSFIISAIVISSALVMHLSVGPQFFGLSAFGLIGYVFAASLGFWLVVMMFTSGQI